MSRAKALQVTLHDLVHDLTCNILLEQVSRSKRAKPPCPFPVHLGPHLAEPALSLITFRKVPETMILQSSFVHTGHFLLGPQWLQWLLNQSRLIPWSIQILDPRFSPPTTHLLRIWFVESMITLMKFFLDHPPKDVESLPPRKITPSISSSPRSSSEASSSSIVGRLPASREAWTVSCWKASQHLLVWSSSCHKNSWPAGLR